MAVALLAACSPDTDYSDLNAFMDEVDSRPRGRVEPLPPIETVPPFSYLASNKRSPFEPPVVLKRVERQSGPKVEPDLNRVKQYLEQFTIGQLAMVGTLSQGATMYALIQDAEGGVHRVQSGDFMGTDHGRIRGVGETGIELIEIVPDGIGGWVERERTVALATGA
jgi:type IV pilus assembly protein PilP